MGNEITLTLSLACTNGGYQLLPQKAVYAQATQATAGKNCVVQIVGTTHEAMAKGDVSSLGWAMLRNLDADHFVDVGVQDGGSAFIACVRLAPAGKPVVVMFSPAAAIYLKADTAPCRVEIDLLEA